MTYAAAAAGLALGGAGLWGRRTRASREERHRTLPGDELIGAPLWQATRATTIAAPPEEVWPWIVQMGYPTHRAGWYTPYWMDRLLFGIRAHSAQRIVPELQGLAVGDRVPDSPDGEKAYFTVVRLEPPRVLVLLSRTHPLPLYEDAEFTWAFVVEEHGPGRSRLLMRARIRYTPVWPAWLVRPLIAAGFGVGDFVQAGTMLGGIRRRCGG